MRATHYPGIFTLLFAVSAAFGQLNDVPHDNGLRKAIVGTWTKEQQRGSNTVIRSEETFEDSGRYTWLATRSETTNMFTGEGKWWVKSNQLYTTAEKTNGVAVVTKPSVDKVIHIDDSKLIYLRANGRTNQMVRKQ